jgi:rhomboid protease GluP
MELVINKKDDIVMKILHFFVTEENYKPVILKGVQNEIWLENFDKDPKLIRININYIHNDLQFDNDLYKANVIRKNIGRKTLSLRTNVLNLLIDTNDNVKITDDKNIFSLKVNKIGDLKSNKFLNQVFPGIKDKLDTKKADLNEFVKLTNELNEKTFRDEQRMDRIFKEKKPIVTKVLIIINILVYLVCTLSLLYKPELNTIITYYGANNYKLIQAQGYIGLYRLVTSMFLHADIFHIFFNMYALYVVGNQVERYYGPKKYLLIYFISGIVGSLFSNVFMSANTISIGASGAIFGLFGALAYFSYNYRAVLGNFLKSSIIPVLIINLCLGLFISGIDVFAHIGGLIAGVLTSMLVGVNGKNQKTNVNILIVFTLLIVFMIYMLFIK